MTKKRTAAQRQRMSAAQKKRYRAVKGVKGTAPEVGCPVDAIIYAKKLVDATNGNTKMATKIVETIGSIS